MGLGELVVVGLFDVELVLLVFDVPVVLGLLVLHVVRQDLNILGQVVVLILQQVVLVHQFLLTLVPLVPLLS